jgi:hypothetical protein
VVGCAKIRKNSRDGAAIDAHDVVFRPNDLVFRNHEEALGTRVDIRLQNCRTVGYRDGNETLLSLCNDGTLRTSVKGGFMRHVYMVAERWDGWAVGFGRLTTGFITAIFAAHGCRSVSLWGFTMGHNVDPESIFERYQARPMTFVKERHNGTSEASCLADLAAAGVFESPHHFEYMNGRLSLSFL